jgi:molecular chaperone GrpE (heat shock protein)
MSSAAEFSSTGSADGGRPVDTAVTAPEAEEPTRDVRGRNDAFPGVDGEGAAGSLTAIGLELAALRVEIGRFQDVVDRLHAENQDLRRGQLDRILDPVIRDVVKLAGDFRRRGQALATDHAVAGATDVVRVCQDVAEDVGMILERNGVEVLVPAPGTRFNRRDHRASGTEQTGDPALDGTIAETRRPGYRLGARIVEFPEVAVYRFAAGPSVE